MALFCCSSIQAYRPRVVDHKQEFTRFMSWASFPKETGPDTDIDLNDLKPAFAVQLVRQVNFGPIESKRYFVPIDEAEFVEICEHDLVHAGFQKFNSFKNFKCAVHNKFFEVNLYQKGLAHGYRSRVRATRPAALIDL